MNSPEPISDLLARAREFPLCADDAADIIIAAIEGKLAPAPGKHAGGRPRIDDQAALAEMIGHVESGASIERAALLVARAHPGHNVDATTKRLARKFRRGNCARN